MFSKQLCNKLMIVAHPDDESIFGGGALISESGWKVICLTNRSNEIRSKEFQQAMKFVGASYEIWDYPDEYDGTFEEEVVKKDIERVFESGSFQRIVTHSLHGEYGHKQHKVLSRILHNMYPENLYVFDTSDEVLTTQILKKKRKLLSHYSSQVYVIEQLETYIVHERILRVAP